MFDSLIVGNEYDRPELAEIWGYESWQAISRGIVTPADENYIILFVTEEKQAQLPQYDDRLEQGILHMEGEKGHGNDDRIVNADQAGEEIHLFHRTRHHQPFIYKGRIGLIEAELRDVKPSSFKFLLHQGISSAISSIQTERIAHGVVDESIMPSEEGRKRIKQHIKYERDPRLRAAAIRFHGANCGVCGFDFNEAYGNDLAQSFIEVHHLTPVSRGVIEVDPRQDLIPLCSNCHSMAHRRSGTVVGIEELRARVGQ